MESKLEELKELISRFSLEEILKFEEKYDRQYLALKKLYENLKNEELFLKLIVLNSVNAFKLRYKGEVFHELFSEFFSKNKDISKFKEFLEKYNNIFLSTKIKRFEKTKALVENLSLKDFENLKKFVSLLAKTLNQKVNDKTIVFTAKMLGYGLRIIGKDITFPFEISIPIDYRIGKISKDKNFWRNLSEKTKIPQLHIDSLIWITYNLELEKVEDASLKEKLKRLKDFLQAF